MERFLHRSALLALAVLVGFAPIAAHTQALAPDNPTDPFWKLLAMVPNDDLSRGYLSYANYQAITEIFDVSGLSYEDVVASVESGEGWAVATLTEQGERWESAMSLTRHSALGLVGKATLGGMPAVLGFTSLDIRQAIVFGAPPSQGYLLTGDFDQDAIRAAFANRDYVRREIAGIEMWCYLDDCTTGLEMYFDNLSTANIFGGALGHREPIALSPGVVMDSAALDTLQLMFTMPEGSLAGASEYHTLAEAMTAQGTVIQVESFPYTYVYFWDFTSSDLTPNVRERAVTSAREFGTLPPYRLFAFGHTWRDGEHYGHLMLVYDTTAEAETAADELYQRLTHAKMLENLVGDIPDVNPTPDTYLELLSQTGEILPAAVYEGTEGAAAVFTVRATPSDPNDPLSVRDSSPFDPWVRLGYLNYYFLGVGFQMPD